MDPRLLAVRVLTRVEEDGAWSQAALDAALGAGGDGDPRDRALATRLVYGTLAWQGRLDHAIAQVASRPLGRLDPLVLRVLRVGAYQSLLLDDVPPHAVVDTAVRAARALGRGPARAAGLVNAVLRRVGDARPPDDADVAAAASLPAWLAARWVARLGAPRALALGRALNAPPPGTIRATGDRLALAARLSAGDSGAPRRDVRPAVRARDGLVVTPFAGLPQHPAFREGQFTVQDEASMLVVDLLDPLPGERVLDLCAGPGGKATHVAQRVGDAGRVDAIDLHPHRVRLVEEAARRLGVADRVAVRAADARAWEGPGRTRPYDRVLVDAPCSSLGTARRRPEVKWRVRPDDLPGLARLQGELLAAGARRVKPGGPVVYAVCSTEPDEGAAVVDAFLAQSPGWTAAERLQTWPDADDMDGFFAARLVAPR